MFKRRHRATSSTKKLRRPSRGMRLLRLRLITAAAHKPRRTKPLWERLSSNQMLNVLLGFILTAVLGGWLTRYYSAQETARAITLADKQKENEQARGFVIELNKRRVDKVAAVVEELWLYSASTEAWLNSIETSLSEPPPISYRPPVSAAEFQKQIQRQESLAIAVRDKLTKNRFWIGETTSQRIEKYLVDAGLREHITGLTLSGVRAQQAHLRLLLAQIREDVWNGK
jgi:hypothetical protein